MATNRRLSILWFVGLLVLISSLPLSGESFFTLDDRGTPQFTQVLSWDTRDNVLEYELAVRNVQGDEVYRSKSAEPRQELHLSPGSYTYCVTLYNLLGKPEVTSDWAILSVIKVEFPSVRSVSPDALYLETGVQTIKIHGHNFMEGAQVSLFDASGEKKILDLNVLSVTPDAMTVKIPRQGLAGGSYRFRVVNEGGLSTVGDPLLTVRLQYPYEFSALAGYAPDLALFDATNTGMWPSTFYPAGASARASFVFMKTPVGFFGVEVHAAASCRTSTVEAATLSMTALTAELGLMYKYRLTPHFFIIGRADAGVLLSTFSFSYPDVQRPAVGSIDLAVSAGAAAQYLLDRHWLLEAGFSVPVVLYRGFVAGGITPSLSAGYLF